jgi:hypothetical protein
MSPKLLTVLTEWPCQQSVLVDDPVPKSQFHKSGATPVVPLNGPMLKQLEKSTVLLRNRVPCAPSA